MALGDVTRPAVLAAIAEFERLKRDDFLDTYHFGPARSYFLVYDGKFYDSKAIIGVAHGYSTGQAWTTDDFSGGDDIRIALENLGFEVDVTYVPEGQSGKDPAPRPLCPGCFTELPASGHCDYCS